MPCYGGKRKEWSVLCEYGSGKNHRSYMCREAHKIIMLITSLSRHVIVTYIQLSMKLVVDPFSAQHSTTQDLGFPNFLKSCSRIKI
jgi:hypothetical protein